MKKTWIQRIVHSTAFILILCIAWLVGSWVYEEYQGESVPYSRALELIDGDATKRVEIDGDSARLFQTDGTILQTVVPEGGESNLYDHLDAAAVSYGVVADSGLLESIWRFSPLVAFYVVLRFLVDKYAGPSSTNRLIMGKRGGLFGNSFDVSKPTTTFKDVGGYEEVKAELVEIAEMLKEPERYERLGVRPPRGVLMYGPTGTGKTLLARALAGELGVTIIVMNASSLISRFAGGTTNGVHELFEMARENAPCVLVIDEIDAIGGRRKDEDSTAAADDQNGVVTALLTEMDGFERETGVIVVAMTNRPDALDDALRRDGRFDRHVRVDLPDRATRLKILERHMGDRPHDDTCDLDRLAGMTSGLAGANLEAVVNEAALLAARRCSETAQIGWEDLMAAFERKAVGIGSGIRLDAAQHRRVAVHETGHALASAATGHANDVQKISILSGAGSLGHNLRVSGDEDRLQVRSDILDDVAVLLGGKIAEEVVFGEASTGGSDDLARVMRLVTLLIEHAGLGEGDIENMVLLEEEDFVDEVFLGQVRIAKRGMIHAQAVRVREVLGKNRELLNEMVEALLASDTLSGAPLQAFLSRVRI